MVVPEGRSGFIVAEAGFVTFAAFTCQKRTALSLRMFIFQRLKALIAEPNWLENRLYFANVTMPSDLILESVQRLLSRNGVEILSVQLGCNSVTI